MTHNFHCDQHGIHKLCDFDPNDQDATCLHLPLSWGRYCAYEKKFISERRANLINIYQGFVGDTFGASGRGGGLLLDHTILWYICLSYADELKVIRQFSDVMGGCDTNRRAALLARLIAKHHPISYQGKYLEGAALQAARGRSGRQDYDPALRANEKFAFHAFCYFLNLSPDLFEQENLAGISSELLSLLSHRDPQIESLVSIARLLSAMEVKHNQVKSLERRLSELEAKRTPGNR